MFKYNVTINSKYMGTVAAITERKAALAACIKFTAADHDCLTVTRVEKGRKFHSDVAAGIAA